MTVSDETLDPPTIRQRLKQLGITTAQARVIQILGRANAPMTRPAIAESGGNRTAVVVRKAIGYTDPELRRKFREKANDPTLRKKLGYYGVPLLDLGMVREWVINRNYGDVHVIELTPKGRSVYKAIAEISIPPGRLGKKPAKGGGRTAKKKQKAAS